VEKKFKKSLLSLFLMSDTLYFCVGTEGRECVVLCFMRRARRPWVLQLSVSSASRGDFCVNLQIPSLASVNFVFSVLLSVNWFSPFYAYICKLMMMIKILLIDGQSGKKSL